MRWITPPPPILLIDPISKRSVTDPQGKPVLPIHFKAFAFQRWLNDLRFGGSLVKLARFATRIVPAFEECQEGVPFSLEDEDFETLRAVVETSVTTSIESPLIEVQLLPHSKAVLDAPDHDPQGAF